MQYLKLTIYSLASIALILTSLTVNAESEPVTYDMSNVKALQNEYQKQLKTPKIKPKKRAQKQAHDIEFQAKKLLEMVPQQRTNHQTQWQRQQQIQARQKQLQQQATQAKAAQRAPAPTNNELFNAASRGDVHTITRLIQRGMNVNVGNAERETALHMAAARGHYSTVIYLINHGANMHSRTINNWLPIHHAARFRHAQIARYLMQRGSSPHAKTSDGLSAVDMARASNDRRVLGALGVH